MRSGGSAAFVLTSGAPSFTARLVVLDAPSFTARLLKFSGLGFRAG
ncbi:uncharacterized protein SOCE26_100590 [Sorangium cellulosum]|uniref:Uncharacterized protein n=1 Tax=Sorangium cellulosum TaxID=56 RepID=A0A2L0FAH5_SORCE|nr:uncharacterized protein SOCE26_100590 [Sorangium cellulosum]